MTKEEYVRSLVDDNVPGDQWFDLVKQWEIANPETEEVEEVEEVVEEGNSNDLPPAGADVDQEIVAPESTEATESTSEDGSLESEDPFNIRSSSALLSNEPVDFNNLTAETGLTLDDINSRLKPEQDRRTRYEEFTTVAEPNETYTQGNNEFKFNFSTDDQGVTTASYLRRTKGSKEWESLKPGSDAYFGISGLFGHSEYDGGVIMAQNNLIKENEAKAEKESGDFQELINSKYAPSEVEIDPEFEYVEQIIKENATLTQEELLDIKIEADEFSRSMGLKDKEINIRGKTDYIPDREFQKEYNKAYEAAVDEIKSESDNPSDIDLESEETQELIRQKIKSNIVSEKSKELKNEKLTTYLQSLPSDFDWGRLGSWVGSEVGDAAELASNVEIGGFSTPKTGYQPSSGKMALALFKKFYDVDGTKNIDAGYVWQPSKTQKLLEEQTNKKLKKLGAEQLKNTDIIKGGYVALKGLELSATAIYEQEYTTPDSLARANAALVSINKQREDIIEVIEIKTDQLTSAIGEKTDNEEFINILSRNYNYVPIMMNNMESSTISMGQGIGTLAFKIANLPVAIAEGVQNVTGLEVPLWGKAKQYLHEGWGLGNETINGILDEYKVSLANDIALPVSVGEIKSFADLGQATFAMTGAVFPQVVAIASTGGYGVYFTAASAGGSKFKEYDDDINNNKNTIAQWNDNKPKRENYNTDDAFNFATQKWENSEPELLNYSQASMYSGAMFSAGIEVVTGKFISLPILNRARNFNPGKVKVGWNKGFGDLLKTSSKQYVKDVSMQGGEEAIAGIGTKLYDRIIMGKDVNLFSDVGDDFFSGVIMTNFFKAPAIFSPYLNSVQTPGDKMNLGNLQNLVKSNVNFLLENPNMSKESKKLLEQDIEKNILKINNNIVSSLNIYSDMPRVDLNALGANEQKSFQITQQIETIKNDEGFKVGKEELLNQLEIQQNNLTGEKNQLLEPYVTKNAEGKVTGGGNLVKPRARAEAINEGARVIAEQLNSGIVSVESTQDFLGAVESIQAQEGSKINLKTNKEGQVLDAVEQDYALVAEVPDADGNIVKQVIINEVSAAADNVDTSALHEAGHLVAAKIFKDTPQTGVNMAKALINDVLNTSDVSVDPKIIARLEQYSKDVENGDLSPEGYYEEVLTVTAEGMANGEIKDTPSLISKLKSYGQNILNNIFGNSQAPKIQFNNGKDVYNFLKDFNKAVESGEGLNEAQLRVAEQGAEGDLSNVQQLDEVVVTAKKSKKQGITPKGIEFSNLVKEGLLNNEGLVDIINAPSSSQVDKFGAIDAVLELNWPVISKGLKFNPTGSIPMDAVKTAVAEQLQGIFPGRNKPLMADFNPDIAQVNTYLGDLMRKRQAEILERANAINATTSDGASIDSDQAKQVVDNSSTNTIPQPKVTAKKSPKGDAIYNSVLQDNLGEDVAKSIDAAIETDLLDMNVGDRFGNTKNIGPKLGQVLGKTFKLDPRVFTDKSWNIKKGDLKGLTNLKQYLNNNSQKDFNLLPDAYNDKGKSNFIPDNILNKLYIKDGKNKWKLNPAKTVLDYKNLLGPIEGAVYRASEATTIKGLAGLSFRNKMFETAVPNAIDRIPTGVKFAKKIGVQQAQINTVKKYGVVPIDQTAEGTSRVVDFVENELPKAFGNLTNLIAKSSNLAGAGNSATTEKGGGALGRGFPYITNQNKTRSEDKLKTKELLENRIVADLEISRNKISADGFVIKTKQDKADARLLNLAIGSQKGKAKVVSNQNLDEGVVDLSKKAFYDGLKKLMKNDRNNIASLQFILGNQNANSGLAKNLATLNNDATQKGDKPYEEHWFQTSQFVSGLITSLTKGTSTLDNFIKFANRNYYQEIISKETQGVVDKSYDITLENGDIVKWKSQNENHPLLTKALNKAIETNKASDWAAADKLADLRKYPGPDVHSVVNPFLHGRNGVSDAVRYDIIVSPTDQLNPNIQYAVNSIIHERIIGDLTVEQSKDRIKIYTPIAIKEAMASKKITKDQGDKVNNDMTVQRQIDVLATYDKAAAVGRDLNTETKGISVFDFDDTLARTKEKVIINMPDGSTNSITAAEFAQQASQLEAEGAVFDFSNFENVSKGTKKGPLADLALKRQGKFGAKDIFVLTARPQIAAAGIKKFLDGIGLNLPLANITGLENGTPGAKGNWVAQKAAEGYNDFYFADDAYKNVEAVQQVLNQIDVKSVVQIAKASKKITFDKIFNDILESSTGIESYKEYSPARAQTVGASKGRFSFFNTPSAEDFTGLLYKTLGKGKVGDAQMAFYKTNLLDPYNRAELSVTKAKISAANDFKALKTNLKSLPKSLSKPTGIGGFTFSQAARVAAWTRQNMEVPGLSKRDVKELNDFVKNNAEMDVFVDELIKIQKGKPYPKPSDSWLGGTITSDILNEINKVNRKAYLQEWQENVDIIFSDKNMSKLEAAYGPNYVEALRDQLGRMKSGSNRPIGGSRVVNGVLDWLNNSVGAVMFLNTRSAVLQTMSAVNFINFGNNNLYKAGKAFANQPQFWKDFKTLMNSPYLTERRNGLKINVSESEIADAVAESSNKPKAAIAYLLNKGFVMTRFADSFAIASGGSTFYRNQLDAYVKDGMSKKDAEKQAFDDFYAIAETSQQSSNPSKISQQQASGAGRVILAFANTPMQYARIIKRSSQDLINNRGDWKANISKIVFYGAVQNLAFNALQNALFADAFGEDEDEEENNKTGRIANGMADSLLRGLGIQGAAVSALKNSILTIADESTKKSPKFVKAVYDLFDFSPPLDSKFRKLRSGANTVTWEKENIKNKGFNLNNPGYLAGSQIISGLTNIPMDRAIQKINNIRAIMSNSSQNWQKLAMAMGWSTWDVGLPYYGVDDKIEMTPQMILKEKVTTMKKDTNTKQQKDMLLELGLTKQQIKALKYEEARIKKILELQEKNLKK